jgi:phosphoglycerate dehydrogenase-like enzyme
MRLLVCLPEPAALAAALQAARPELDIRARSLRQVTAEDMEWAEAMMGFRKPAVPGWGNIRWVHSIGAGVDGILQSGDVPEGMLVTRSSEDFGPAIGEYCIARALAVTQRMHELDAAQRRREWAGTIDPVRIAGTRAVIVGTGMVGQGIARCFAAMGCTVDGLSRTGADGRTSLPRAERGGPADRGFNSVGRFSDFGRTVKGADWLILALPRTPDTIHLVNRARLAECDGAYLINIGRGAVIEEAALPEALDKGWISGAALDVFEKEPLPADSPLWSHPKITVTPHCSGPSTMDGMVNGFVETLQAVERGEKPKWAVDHLLGY